MRKLRVEFKLDKKVLPLHYTAIETQGNLI